ncbi:MAG: hypothetical protein ACT4RN_16220 [Pseudonocardia sp.]
MGSKKITMTITSTAGCTVKVDGTATWDGPTAIPPRGVHNFGFTGTLTFGGGTGCPSGTMEFRSARPGGAVGGREAVAVLDVPDPAGLRRITWRAPDRRMSALLNDPSASAALCARLRAAPAAEDHRASARL